MSVAIDPRNIQQLQPNNKSTNFYLRSSSYPISLEIPEKEQEPKNMCLTKKMICGILSGVIVLIVGSVLASLIPLFLNLGLSSLRNQTFNKFLNDIPLKINEFSSILNTTKPILQQTSTSNIPISLNNNLNTNRKILEKIVEPDSLVPSSPANKLSKENEDNLNLKTDQIKEQQTKLNTPSNRKIDARKEPTEPNENLKDEFINENVAQKDENEQDNKPNALQEFAESSEFLREQSASKPKKQDEISLADDFNFDFENNEDLRE